MTQLRHILEAGSALAPDATRLRDVADLDRARGSDRSDLIAEIDNLVRSERLKLAEQGQRYQAEAHHYRGSAALQQVFSSAFADLERAAAAWSALAAFVGDRTVSDNQAFIESMAMCGYAIRASAAARSSLIRHTPTLRGYPGGLDPSQSVHAGPQGYTVDYLRGGYVLYQQPGVSPPSRYADHAILQDGVGKLVRSLYPGSAGLEALAFTCGIAALDAVMDVLAARSLKTGQCNYLGRNCWIELRRRVDTRDPRHFQLYDDNTTAHAAELLLRPNVQSVWIEGIQNHPDMRVTDFAVLRDAVRQLPPGTNKVLVVDNVATFDSNVFSAFNEPDLKGKISIICAVSLIKFFQNGSDSVKAGLLALELNDSAGTILTELIEARAGSGKAPSYEEVLAAGSDTALSLGGRMRRYDRNNRRLAERLAQFGRDSGDITISSPWLDAHPDHRRALAQHGHGGRFVYLRLTGTWTDYEQRMLDLYRVLADEAQAAGAALIAASSFGFSVPHIHIVRHQGIGLSIRLSAGSVHADMVECLLTHIEQTVSAHAR